MQIGFVITGFRVQGVALFLTISAFALYPTALTAATRWMTRNDLRRDI